SSFQFPVSSLQFPVLYCGAQKTFVMSLPFNSEEHRQAWGKQLAAYLAGFPLIAEPIEALGFSKDPTRLISFFEEAERRKDQSAEAFIEFLTILGFNIEKKNKVVSEAEKELDCANAQLHAVLKTNTDLHEQIRQLKMVDKNDLQRQLTEAQAELQGMKYAISHQPAPTQNPQPSHHRISKDPDRFSGETTDMTKRQQEYVNWKSTILTCFLQDNHVFSNERTKLLHIFGLLSGAAHENNRIYFDEAVKNPNDPKSWTWKTATQLFTSLDAQYETINLKLDASIKFDVLYQKKTPFPNFIALFQNLSQRCGKTEEQKVEALKKKVSVEIAQKLATLDSPPSVDDFDGWVKKCARFYENLQEYEHNQKAKNHDNPFQRTNPKPQTPQPATIDMGDPMQLDRAE
ncbi:hypothetical protein K3495_g15736, partial [Podosphaera aphanis]